MRILAIAAAMMIAGAAYAQDIRIDNIAVETAAGENIEFPNDLNGNKCGMVKVRLDNPGVVFEGNVIGEVTNTAGEYRIFLSPKSKYLNIKYPGANAVRIRFSDYGIPAIKSGETVRIDATEPSADIAEQLDAAITGGSDEADSLYTIASSKMAANDFIGAYDYILKAHELGNPKATYQLGFIYADPFHQARKGAKLIGMPLPEMPVVRDEKKAAELYRQSAEAGYVTAQFALGECYEKGTGVKKNKNEAKAWYGKAAAQGHLQAQDKIGMKVKKHKTLGITTAYGSGDGEFLPQSIDCDPNDLTAITQGRTDAAGQYCALVKVLLPFEGVTFAGDTVGAPVFSTNEYRVYLPQGTKELTVNYSDFKPLKISFKDMGVNLLTGKNTYSLHLSFPIDLLQQDDKLTADECYNIGMGYADRRDSQYVRWMAKAAEKGHTMGLYSAGVSYLYGTGVKKDEKRGMDMLMKASDAGSGEASYIIGLYHQTKNIGKVFGGKGGGEAEKWFKKAEEQGYQLSSEGNKFGVRILGL